MIPLNYSIDRVLNLCNVAKILNLAGFMKLEVNENYLQTIRRECNKRYPIQLTESEQLTVNAVARKVIHFINGELKKVQ